jgi:serine/threonine protein kinase
MLNSNTFQRANVVLKTNAVQKIGPVFQPPQPANFLPTEKPNDLWQKIMFMCMFDSITSDNRDFFDYLIEDYVSEGGFGVTFRCKHLSNPQTTLIMKITVIEDRKLFKKETDSQLYAQSRGYSPRILAIFYGTREVIDTNDGKKKRTCCFIMEYGGSMTLSSYLKKLSNEYYNTSDPLITSYFTYDALGKHLKGIFDYILFTIEDLCDGGYIHGDTHMANILIHIAGGTNIDEPNDVGKQRDFFLKQSAHDMARHVKVIDYGMATIGKCEYNRFAIDFFELFDKYGYVIQNIMVQWATWPTIRPFLSGKTPQEQTLNLFAQKVYPALITWINTDKENDANKKVVEFVRLQANIYRMEYYYDNGFRKRPVVVVQ